MGIIMDGNRRWAEANNATIHEAYIQGARKFQEIGGYILSLGIPYLSVYALSSENLDRKPGEVEAVLSAVRSTMRCGLEDFKCRGARIVWIGSEEGLDEATIDAMRAAEVATSANQEATVAIYLNYSGQQEIVEAVRGLMERAISPEEVTIQGLSQAMSHPEIPAPDLVVRSGGDHRISGFMPWHIGFSQLDFKKPLWPDFTKRNIDEALELYAASPRTFGR